MLLEEATWSQELIVKSARSGIALRCKDIGTLEHRHLFSDMSLVQVCGSKMSQFAVLFSTRNVISSSMRIRCWLEYRKELEGRCESSRDFSVNFAILTKVYCNLDKYSQQFTQIHFAIWTNKFLSIGNSWGGRRRSVNQAERYPSILQLGQINFQFREIHFAIQRNTFFQFGQISSRVQETVGGDAEGV